MKNPSNICIARIKDLLSRQSVCKTILPLMIAVPLFMPQPVLAQECTTEQGTIDESGAFTKDTLGQDFKIACKGELDDAFVVDTQARLVDESGYTESQSKVIIDLSEVTGDKQGITIHSDAGETILIGTITNDDKESGSVVFVSEVEPDSQTNDGVPYDVNVKSQAMISSEDRIGLQLEVTDEGGDESDATLENAGTIATKGEDALGLSAWVDPGDPDAKSVLSVTNSGTIETEGVDAHGLEAGAAAGKSNASRVMVDNSGTITTSGAGASGLSAYLKLNAAATDTDANALGRVSVTNSGEIKVSGDGATGLEAVYRHNPGKLDEDPPVPAVEIVNSGHVSISNSGTITASGNKSKGIYARAHGTGNVNIRVSGAISAGHKGTPASNSEGSEMEGENTAAVPRTFGIGVHGQANTDIPSKEMEEGDEEVAAPEPEPDDDVDVVIVVSGSSASIMAYGTSSDEGIGILAETDSSTGESHVSIGGGAQVSAYGATDTANGDAVMFKGGKGILNINGANLVGNIMFTGQDDVLNIDNTGSIAGDIDFGRGKDSMNLNIGEDQQFQITGDVTGLTTLNKKGAGYVRLGGDVTFQGSTSTLNLEDGALVIAGKLDLGSGKVTVHKAGRIVFEIGSDGSTGSINAGSMHFEEVGANEVSVYAQLSDDLLDTQVAGAQNGLASRRHTLLTATAITSGTADSSVPVTSVSIKTVKADDETATVGLIDYAGGVGTATFNQQTVSQIAKLNAELPEEPVSSGGGDDNNNAILGLGLVAVLVALYWGDGLFGSSFADDYAFNTPQSAYIASVDEASTLTLRETGNQPYQVWIRTGLQDTMQLAGVKNAGVSGTEIGLSLYRSDDFYIEASSAQDVAAQVSSLNQSAQGEVYALSSGWQNERYFAGVKLSYGDFDTDTVIDNPVVKSTLVSQSEVRHTQAQFTAGTRWNTGNLMFTPSASVQAGTFDYSAHQAQGVVVNAEVPSYTQDYSALRVGLKMSASDWLSFSDNVKWKPHLQFDQIHTDSGSGGDVTLRQMDRLGALSFNSGASVQSMPEVVNAVSFGTSVKTSKSSQSEWKFGYAGLEADGEYYHAAVAAYQMRF